MKQKKSEPLKGKAAQKFIERALKNQKLMENRRKKNSKK